MMVVDRAGYLAWTEGVLLRFDRGVGVVADEPRCLKADAALAEGKKVALSVGGEIVSYLEPREDGIYEVEASDET